MTAGPAYSTNFLCNWCTTLCPGNMLYPFRPVNQIAVCVHCALDMRALEMTNFIWESKGIRFLSNKFLQCKSRMEQRLYAFLYLLFCVHGSSVYPKGRSLNITSCYCTVSQCTVLQQLCSRDRLEALHAQKTAGGEMEMKGAPLRLP